MVPLHTHSQQKVRFVKETTKSVFIYAQYWKYSDPYIFYTKHFYEKNDEKVAICFANC